LERATRTLRDARQQRRARAELAAAASALSQLAVLVAQGRERYDAKADRRAHVRCLWIVVDSRLKNHSSVLAIPRAAGEFAQAVGLRQKLAYTAPERIDDHLVWRTSEGEAASLAAEVAATLDALP